MPKRTIIAVLTITVAWVLGVGAVQYFKYTAFGYNGLDLGIYAQVVWGLSQGFGFLSSIHDPSYLGDHLELILVPLALLYRVFDSPLTLLWAQTAAMALSALPLSILVQRVLGVRWVPWVVALWLINPLLLNAALYEFHGLTFAAPVLLWSILAYRNQRLWPWIFSLVLLCAIREDMPLLVAGWSLYALLDRRSWRWWAPGFVLAAVWFVLAQYIIAQATPAGTYKYLAFYTRYGTTYAEILSYPFRHPLIFLQTILGPNNLQTIIGFLMVFGALPLLRLRRLIPISILAAQLLITASAPYSVLRLHYVIPYLPFLLWASLIALRDIRDGALIPRFDRIVAVPLVTILFLLGPVYSQSIYGPLERPWPLRTATAETRPDSIRQALTHVRPDDRVITTFRLLPHLANRTSLYSLNYLYLGRRQYSETAYTIPTDVDVAVIDWQQIYDYQFLYRDTAFNGATGSQRIRELLERAGLRVAYERENVTVYSRRGTLPERVPELVTDSSPGTAYGPVRVYGAPLVAIDQEQPQTIRVELVAGIDEAQTDPLSLRVTLQNGTTVTWLRLVGPKTRPMVDWKPGERWRQDYVLELPAGLEPRGEVTAEFIQFTGRYRFNRLRSFVPHVSEEQSFGTITLGSLPAAAE